MNAEIWNAVVEEWLTENAAEFAEWDAIDAAEREEDREFHIRKGE